MEAFGINLVNLIIYVVLFVILYLVIDKHLVKKLNSVLDSRKKEIQEGLNRTAESKKLLEKARNEEMAIMHETKLHAKGMVDTARSEAQVEYDAIIKEAKERAKNIILSAEQLREKEEQKLKYLSEKSS